jgi:bacteriorhodopsin
MDHILDIMTWLYISSTFISSVTLFFFVKKSKATAKIIFIILSIASGWAVLNNIFWFFNHHKFLIVQKIPLFPEYTDFLVTTPLSLMALGLFSMKNIHKDKKLLSFLILMNIIMFLTGAFAEYSNELMGKILFWLGMIPYGIIMFILWKTFRLKARKQSKYLYTSYIHLSLVITLFWPIYPLFWYLGPFGMGVISLTTVKICYYFTNLITKAGYYFFMVRKLNLLEQESMEDGGLK